MALSPSLVGAVPAAALCSEVGGEQTPGFGHDTQTALFADDDELATDAVFKLVQRAILPANFLVGDQLQGDRVSHLAYKVTEDHGLD
jgi:hypothetical protein